METGNHRIMNHFRDFHDKEISSYCNDFALVRHFLLVVLAWVFLSDPVVAVQTQTLPDLSLPQVRSAYVHQLAIVNSTARAEAKAWARAHGFPIWHDDEVRVFGLMYLRNGRPVYYVTENVNAAVTTATDKVRDKGPYHLDGSGLTIGVWDVNGIRVTHQEFGSRVRILDGAWPARDHSTHVAGTIGAAGVDPRAIGMAPGVKIDYYDFTADMEEMAERGASVAGEQNKIYVSNHSYGLGSGWEYTDIGGEWGWYWWSEVWNGADSTASLFGQYELDAEQVDEVAYGAPYYLVFTSAGNHRTDNPSTFEPVYYWSGGLLGWQKIPYTTSTCPPGDGVVKGGYDTIVGKAVGKNVMTIGSVTDAVNRDGRYLPNARMSSFSSWGPADDGRIKPDIVANGDDLFSPVATSDSSYSDEYLYPFSGTSMSSPNASGSAILLVQYYNKLFPGQAMRSSTLKGLILHTTDDPGNPGPDYSYGWGLMNTEAAAALIKKHYNNPLANRISEASLHALNSIHSYDINADGKSPIRATLCWTDPPASVTSRHNDASPRLVNDLDLRVIGPDGSLFYPFVLDPNNPSAPATTGDNTIDNVEQVLITKPRGGPYTIQISYKGTLKNDEQIFSLILSGISSADAPLTPSTPIPPDGENDVPVDTMLSWSSDGADGIDSPGGFVTWYVFFGTNPDALKLICEDLSEPTCDPGTLDYETTYYWQVVTRDDNGIIQGPIWSFTTQSP